MSATAGKIALITGANKGIGFEVARQLARHGCTVLLGARQAALGRAAEARLKSDGLDARFLELDLLRQETIDAAAAQIARDFARLDILVNNAAIGDRADGPPSAASLETVQRIFQTNFFGTLAVTQAMLPLVRQAPAGRIVNVSSGLGSLHLNGDPQWFGAAYKHIGYCGSKAALNMMTVHLAYELRDTPIKVNSSDPGYTATDLNGNRGFQTVEQGAAETVRLSLLPSDGPTGTFSATAGPEPW